MVRFLHILKITNVFVQLKLIIISAVFLCAFLSTDLFNSYFDYRDVEMKNPRSPQVLYSRYMYRHWRVDSFTSTQESSDTFYVLFELRLIKKWCCKGRHPKQALVLYIKHILIRRFWKVSFFFLETPLHLTN